MSWLDHPEIRDRLLWEQRQQREKQAFEWKENYHAQWRKEQGQREWMAMKIEVTKPVKK